MCKQKIYFTMTVISLVVSLIINETNKENKIKNIIYSKVENIDIKKTEVNKRIENTLEILKDNINKNLNVKTLNNFGAAYILIKNKDGIIIKKDKRENFKEIIYFESKENHRLVKIGIPEEYYLNMIEPGLKSNNKIEKELFKLNDSHLEINIYLPDLKKQIKKIDNKKYIEEIVKQYIIINLIISMIILTIYLVFKITVNRKEELKKEVSEKTKELEELNKGLEEKIKKEISRVKEIEGKLRQTEKISSMGEMIGNIAHQWRQPLTSISTIASSNLVMIEHNMFEQKNLEKDLNRILEQTTYLSETIDDFRDFLKPEERNSELFDIKESIEKAFTLTESVLKNNYIKLDKDIESAEIKGVKNYLTQIIVNIINNSKDAFNSREIVDRKINIFAKESGGKVYIIIEDNAGGIKENIINRIFEPYFTTKHKSQGTGLGLSMCYSIIQKYFTGDIRVKNTENKEGVRFTIELKKEEII